MPQRLMILVKRTAMSMTTGETHKTLKNAPMNHVLRVLSTGIGGKPVKEPEAKEGGVADIEAGARLREGMS